MSIQGYDYDRDLFAELLIKSFFPEKTTSESALLRDYLKAHIREFDRVSFSVRVGEGAPLDPSLTPNVARQQRLATQKRIDFVGWRGNQAVLVEAKKRVGDAVMGQLLADRLLWQRERPDDPDPELVAIGRESSEEAIGVLLAHGITVYLYADATVGAPPDAGGV